MICNICNRDKATVDDITGICNACRKREENDCGDPKWERALQHAEYWKPTSATVMVPVFVEYHAGTDVVFAFIPPTMEDVEKAVKQSHNKCKHCNGTGSNCAVYPIEGCEVCA